jgi:Subtilase family
MPRTTTGPIVALLLALAVPTAASASAYESDPSGYARGLIVPAGLTPPAAFAPIGLVDDVVDRDVPDVAQVKVLKKSPGKTLNLASKVNVEHGTEVASVAAGRADGQGVIGVAPGAPLLSWGYAPTTPEEDEEGVAAGCDQVAEGVLALADAGAKVINLSMDGDKPCPDVRRAIGAVYGDGVLVVASAGNQRLRRDPIQYPGAYPHVLTVGSTGLDGLADADSSTGTGVDLVAPGESIPVALPSALDDDGTADGIARANGTSFAAPMVSGVALWLIAARPGLSPSQYADILRATAKDLGASGWDARTGFGIVNLAAALTAPVPVTDRGEPNDEVAEVDGRVFDKPDAYLSGTSKATAAPAEDPVDIYRVRVKARSSMTIRLTATSKALSLSAYANTKRVAQGKTVKVRNATGKARTYYAVVRASGARVAAALAYALKIG